MEVVNKFAPLAMAWIMFVVGTSTSINQFKEVIKFPKSLLLGFLTQVVFVPIIGIVIAYLSPVSDAYKIGILLLSCVPSAVMSNYLTKTINGNTALSISLTAICSFFSFITIPFFLGIGLKLINSSETLNTVIIFSVAFKIFLIVTIPVIIGLIFKTFFEKIVVLLNKFFDTSSFLLFLSIILSAAYIEKDILVTGFKDIGILVFIIFFSIFLICQSFLNQFKLNKLDKRCILTENVIQNNALSIIVGGMMLAKYQGLLVFPAVYAIFQYKVFIIYILYRTFKYKQ
ncbi:hypothetical protein JI56_00560 [SAR11 cluster bacterium PRT-SC02]|nr:hypothetical protein JI56_00560 [SAR11 cluster bacterium PRT-SC02]